MSIKYIATSHASSVPTDHQIFCVDGIPAGWEPKEHDHVWDHHRQGGALIQIDEMPEPGDSSTVLGWNRFLGSPLCILTAQVDADAVVAACWLQLTSEELDQAWLVLNDGRVKRLDGHFVGDTQTAIHAINSVTPEMLEETGEGWLIEGTKELLQAIAYDCDHLGVPADSIHLKSFAANVVAGFKLIGWELRGSIGGVLGEDAFSEDDIVSNPVGDCARVLEVLSDSIKVVSNQTGSEPEYWQIESVGYPENRSFWNIQQRDNYNNTYFRVCVEEMLKAIRGERPFPGTLPSEVDGYWRQVETDSEMLLYEKSPLYGSDHRRVGSSYKSCLICDQTGINRRVDPRSFVRAVEQLQCYKKNGIEAYRPFNLTVGSRYDGSGICYTIGSFAEHPDWKNLDFWRDGVYEALTAAELAEWEFKQEERSANLPHPEGWSGRSTVGGSGRNAPSYLFPERIIDIVLRCTSGR